MPALQIGMQAKGKRRLGLSPALTYLISFFPLENRHFLIGIILAFPGLSQNYVDNIVILRYNMTNFIKYKMPLHNKNPKTLLFQY